jgi:hypothetical protein
MPIQIGKPILQFVAGQTDALRRMQAAEEQERQMIVAGKPALSQFGRVAGENAGG